MHVAVLTDEFRDPDVGKVLEHVATNLEVSHVAFRKIGDREITSLDDDEVHSIRDAVRDLGLHVSSISGSAFKIPWWGPPGDEDEMPDGTPVREQQLQMLERGIEIATILGARYVRAFGLHDVSFFTDVEDEMLASWIEIMNVSIGIAERRGKVIVLENVRNSLFSTGESITRILGRLPPATVQLLFDPSNLLASGRGERFSPGLHRAIGDRTADIHVRDATITSNEPYATAWVMFGDGVVDWNAIARAYLDGGYAGFWTIEPHLEKGDGYANVTTSVRRFKEFMASI